MTTATIGANTGDTFSGVADTRLDENAPTTNYGSNAQLQVDKYSAGNHQNTLIKFSGLSNISSGVTVSASSINLWFESGAVNGVSQTISAYKCLRAWVEAQATWNVYSTGNSWTTAGGLSNGNDVDTSVVTSATFDTVNLTLGAYLTISGGSLNALVEGWINGGITNNGVLMERTGGADDTMYALYTSSAGTDGHRPYLSVTYTAGATTTRGAPFGLGTAFNGGRTFTGIIR